MAKVHITLVGKQIMPIAEGVRYANPDKVILIYSDDKSSIENVRKIISFFKHDSNISFEKRQFDAVDVNDINRKIEKIRTLFQEDKISINISSGTKTWAYCFTTLMGMCSNVEVFYVDQNSTIWNLTKNTQEQLQFDMRQQLILYFGSLPNYIEFENVENEVAKDANKCNQLYLFNPSMFSALVAKARKDAHLTHWEQKGNFLDWDKKTKTLLCHLNKFNKSLTLTLDSPQARKLLLDTAWFEYKVAKLLSQWDKVRGIWWGCVFVTDKNVQLNEIDLIVNLGKKLLFVECKTKIDSPTDLDKFASATRNFSGSSTISLFISNNPTNDIIKLKCDYNKIICYSLQEHNDDMTPLISELEKRLNTQNA